MKQSLVGDWVQRVVPGNTVLDTFCANGMFSFQSCGLGAKAVTGVDFEQSRISAAQLVARLATAHQQNWDLQFRSMDIYDIGAQFDHPFDVVLCLGGLYHIADPPHILSMLRRLTTKWLIVQTANILPLAGRWARFNVRHDRTGEGLSSVRGGYGVWWYSPSCFREILRHAHFEVVEECRPDLARRVGRYPWYAALAKPM